MSHILIINPILYTSETNRIPRVHSIKDTMIYTLCLGFVQRGQQVTLIAAQDYRPDVDEKYDFTIIFMKTIWHRVFQPRCLPYMPELRGYLRKHREYDHIITSEVFATWSYTAARICPEKTIIWHELAKHNNMLRRVPSRVWYRFVAGTLMQKAVVVPRSEAAAAFIGGYMRRVSEEIIDHGVNMDKLSKSCGSAVNPGNQGGKKEQFAVVSQLIPRKRIDRVIDGFARFRQKGHEAYRLYVIGKGESEPMLREQVQKLGLTDAVYFCGQLPHEELLPIVAQSKALLVATQKDNNMVSIVESIAVGTPVVTTPVPYNAGYIRREKLGIVQDNWGSAALMRVCEDNASYVENCMKYREKLSNAYCAGQFLEVMGRRQ